jgi:hypothetical protein
VARIHQSGRKGLRCLADLDHQRVAGLPRNLIGVVGFLPFGYDRCGYFQPALDVQQLLCNPERPSQQHPVTKDVVIQARIEAAVADKVDVSAEDRLEGLLQSEHLK